MNNIIQLKNRKRESLNLNDKVHSATIERMIDTRVSSTTVLSLQVKATLVDGKVLYVTYGDWDIVWSIYAYSSLTVKGLKYSKPLINMLEKQLAPIKEELEEMYYNSMRNKSILGEVITW